MSTICLHEPETQPIATGRLVGYVKYFSAKGRYGFITINGWKETDGRWKQWHFHVNGLAPGQSQTSIGIGVVVEFTPVPCPVAGKRDKAAEIEVVG